MTNAHKKADDTTRDIVIAVHWREQELKENTEIERFCKAADFTCDQLDNLNGACGIPPQWKIDHIANEVDKQKTDCLPDEHPEYYTIFGMVFVVDRFLKTVVITLLRKRGETTYGKYVPRRVSAVRPVLAVERQSTEVCLDACPRHTRNGKRRPDRETPQTRMHTRDDVQENRDACEELGDRRQRKHVAHAPFVDAPVGGHDALPSGSGSVDPSACAIMASALSNAIRERAMTISPRTTATANTIALATAVSTPPQKPNTKVPTIMTMAPPIPTVMMLAKARRCARIPLARPSVTRWTSACLCSSMPHLLVLGGKIDTMVDTHAATQQWCIPTKRGAIMYTKTAVLSS